MDLPLENALGSFLCPPGFAGPRGLLPLVREGSALTEVARGRRRSRADRRTARSMPYAAAHRAPVTQPVLLVPGFMAGDWSLAAMSVALRRQGYRTYRSHIACNVGCTREAAERLERRIEAIATRRESKVSIVGHSLGGMLARGLAARRPELIEGIVTLGSPVLAPGAVHDVLGWQTALLARLNRAGVAGVMGIDCVAGPCARDSWTESQAPLAEGVGFTAIFSRRDGIVDWRSCADPVAEHVEVRTSHVGMAVDPVVLDHILTALREQQLSAASRQAGLPATEGRLRAVST